MRRIAAAGGAVVLGLLPVTSAAAGTAPTYVTSEPGDGATVDQPPSRVSVTFSEPLDPSSTLQVFDQCGRAADAGDEQVLGSRIDVGMARTPAGHYTAVYVAKGFGGATGETKGSFSFHVTSGERCDGGHGEHGAHGGNGNEGGHGGHGGNGDEGGHGDGDHGGGAGDAHEGGHDGDDHDMDHSATEGHGATHGGGGHDDKDHRGRGGHGGGEHSGHHDGPRPGHDASGGNRGTGDGLGNFAAGPGAPRLAPTSTSVLIALGLSVAMGALGGWVLRASARS